MGTALETAGPAAQALLANPVTATAAATVLGLGALAYYAYNHWSEQQNNSSADANDGEDEAPRAKENRDAERGIGDNGGPPLNEPPPIAPMVPPGDSKTEDYPSLPETIRPSKADLQRLVDEHSDPKGLPLTPEAAKEIINATQPEGTNATIVGKNVQGSDVLYTDANGETVTGVQVKTAKNLKQAEAAVREDLGSEEPSPIIALQIPADTSIPRLLGKLRNNFPNDDTSRTSILAIDPQGNILIELQPFPK